MKSVYTYLSSILIVFVVSGCATGPNNVEYSPVTGESLQPKELSQVKVYQTKKPDRAYTELGILEYRAGTSESYPEVVAHFKTKAAQVGADGVIIMGSSSGPSMPLAGVIATLTDYQAMAIKFSN